MRNLHDGADEGALTAHLVELERACRELEERSALLRRNAERIRDRLRNGARASAIVAAGDGISARREEREAWARVNRALHDYRVALVRSLVDDEGMTISEAARATGNARQVVSRLYHGSASPDDGLEH
jgi:predicted transcriptional regulator